MEIIYYCEAFKLTYRAKCDKKLQIHSRKKRFDPNQKGLNRLTYDIKTREDACNHYIEYWNKNCSKNGVEETNTEIRGYCNLYRTLCDTLEEDKRIVAAGGKLTLAPKNPEYKLKSLNFDLQVPLIGDQSGRVGGSTTSRKRRRKMRQYVEDNPYFCPYFEGRCYYQDIYNDESSNFCSVFSFTQHSYCPAYPKIEFRLGCAQYRKYCMNNAAQFEIIDWAVV